MRCKLNIKPAKWFDFKLQPLAPAIRGNLKQKVAVSSLLWTQTAAPSSRCLLGEKQCWGQHWQPKQMPASCPTLCTLSIYKTAKSTAKRQQRREQQQQQRKCSLNVHLIRRWRWSLFYLPARDAAAPSSSSTSIFAFGPRKVIQGSLRSLRVSLACQPQSHTQFTIVLLSTGTKISNCWCENWLRLGFWPAATRDTPGKTSTRQRQLLLVLQQQQQLPQQQQQSTKRARKITNLLKK